MIKHLMVCCLDDDVEEDWMELSAVIPSTVDATDNGIMKLLSNCFPMIYGELQAVAELDGNDNVRLIWCSDSYADKLCGCDLYKMHF